MHPLFLMGANRKPMHTENPQEQTMRRNTRSRSALLACLLAIGLSSAVLAEEQSSCITCHLDEAMVLKNLSAVKAKKSAMQSGAG
jgi:hypothetical protein